MFRLLAPLLVFSGCSVFLGSDDDSPVVTILPDSAEFGKVVIGVESASVMFQVVGLENTRPLEVDLEHDDFGVTSDNCTGVELLRGQICRIEVSFAPGRRAVESAALAVGGNIASLDGEGLDPGDLLVEPPVFEFGDVIIGDTVGHLFDLTNSGDGTIENISVVSNDPSFEVVSNLCDGTDLASEDSCPIDVNFTPLSESAIVSSLSITGTDDAGTIETAISLGGRGVTPQYKLSVSVTGGGMVSSVPLGISCRAKGDACEFDYDNGTVVTLTATAGIEEWMGDCFDPEIATPNCIVVMNQDRVVEARFPPPAQEGVAPF